MSLSASPGLDKVFFRGCVFLLGYLISFCLGIMNNFYALIHRYIYIYMDHRMYSKQSIKAVFVLSIFVFCSVCLLEENCF